MLKLDKKQYWIIGLCTVILSFIMLFIGIKVIAASQVSIENVLAYIVFSLLVGGVASALIFFRLKIAFLSYIAGLLLGFVLMYRTFLYDMSGWGDLIGVISLLIWTIIGLGTGLLVQLAFYLFKKYKST
ncbi:MAG: hypothetical protein A2Y23_06210 [Clostridiales bacterium GWB2_37_7]|nr:MAG: hypothetical protein A2Y23_06210 [Clostridiales bacterium GWB2_37_7]